MKIDEIKKLFGLRTLYGIPLRVSADAPPDCIAVSPEVMRKIVERGSMFQLRWGASDDRRRSDDLSDDLASVTGHAQHSQ